MQMSAMTVIGLIGAGAALGIGAWECVRQWLDRRSGDEMQMTDEELVDDARTCLAMLEYRPGMRHDLVLAIYRAKTAVYELEHLIAGRAGRGGETLPQSGAGPAAPGKAGAA